MMIELQLIIVTTLVWSAPYIFAALGGVISEKSGVVNIGLEGMMTIGALIAAATAFYSHDPWLGFLAGGLAGMMLSLLHAVASISFKADQTISGLALNLIGPGLALFISRIWFKGSTTTITITNKLPTVLGGKIDVTVLLAVVATVILWFIIYKTKWGLRIMAVGEYPAVADTLGVSVYGIRYVCVLCSGFLAGLGGAAVTLAIESSFGPASISGQGFIALAAVIFGKWKPHGALFACLLFGFAKALAILNQSETVVPTQIILMLPYVVTLIVLVLFVGKSVAPKADGKPYRKGNR